MWKLELVCFAIVALFLGVRGRLDPEPGRFFGRVITLFVAAWLAENTVIHAYGFYYYSKDWTIFIDRVPLMVLVIWPVVIHSAWDLARHLLKGHPKTELFAAVFVFFDASMIEPIAVESKLWFWTEPGLFQVPPIGVLGWAVFAAFAMSLMKRRMPAFGVILLSTLGTHLVLLSVWWGFFRWVNGPIPGWLGAGAIWVVSIFATAMALRTRARLRVPLIEMALRIPAALFFLALMAMYCLDVLPLVVYALAFVPPYVALTPWRGQGGS